ncbi:hypothetical protein M8J77_018699 [Diaphorina citri]|nr:hypothetical protein M8J77_018699 [Diaphorina citri]
MPGVVKKKYELTSSKLQTHEFTQEINNLVVVFKVLFLNNSLYIYISEQNHQTLSDLSFVLPNSDGLSTRILGSGNENISTSLGTKVAHLVKKPVYLSVNINHNLYLIEKQIEQRLFDEIKNNRDRFIASQ